ncbi:MAG: chromate efflux transporter [Bacteroidota bacterium]
MNRHLPEVAAVFFKLGCIAFGGPAAHVAMMEKEIIEKRQWMSREHFLDLMGATNLIPGPNSTEMTMHCGYERAGWPGLFVAGICFIFPAVVLTGFLAALYVQYGTLPAVQPFIYGIKPAVLAIILGAVIKLGKKALKNNELGIIGTLTLLASLAGLSEVIALLAAGVLGMMYFILKNRIPTPLPSFAPWIILQMGSLWSIKIPSLKIALIFLKVGAILYGSGYVLFAYLDAELVATGLLSRQELIDAIAVGQFTPGPVLSTSTFIGYQLNGFAGAVAATVGIFLPSFLFVLLLNPWIPKMRQSKWLSYFLDAVNIAAVAVMVSVLWSMGRAVLVNWPAILILLLSLLANFQLKLGSVWIVLGGAILGALLQSFV